MQRIDDRAAWIMLLFMLVLAAWPAARAVEGLDWGPMIDFSRDGSFVRGLLDGHFGEDPTYKGESLWYTPLLFVIEASIVKITGVPVEIVLARAGVWLNLLAPLCFFIMVRHFRGPAMAVVSTAVYLFFTIGQEPGWAVGTYSPWLIPASFVQAFFFIELILIDRAFKSTRVLPSVLAGAGAGITFIAHAAPGIMSVLMIAILTMWDLVRIRKHRIQGAAVRRFLLACVAGAAFVICAMPLLWFVIGEYGLHPLNRAPFQYSYYALTIRHADAFLHFNATLVNLLALIGVILLVRKERWSTQGGARLFLLWLVLGTGLFSYSYMIVVADTKWGIELPGTVPALHFVFYLKAASAFFAAYALLGAVDRLSAMTARFSGKRFPAAYGMPGLGLLLCVLSLIAAHYPAYADRHDLISMRWRSLELTKNTDAAELFKVIRKEMDWDDVVLCNQRIASFPVIHSARKVVATMVTMANPYVVHPERERAMDSMFAALEGTEPMDTALLQKYAVTHLLVNASEEPALVERARWFPHEIYRNASYALFARE